MVVYVVQYREEKYGESFIYKIYDSLDKAEKYIKDMGDTPEEDEEGYANDDYVCPDFLYITEIELE